MGFIDNNLLNSEEVKYRGKLHWAFFIKPAIVSVPLVIGMMAGSGACAVGLLIVAGLSYLSYNSHEIGVTNKRVIGKRGVISQDSFETLLIQMEGITFSQSILGRMLNYGNIKTSGTGGKPIIFGHISDPLMFRRWVNEEIEKAHAAKHQMPAQNMNANAAPMSPSVN